MRQSAGASQWTSEFIPTHVLTRCQAIRSHWKPAEAIRETSVYTACEPGCSAGRRNDYRSRVRSGSTPDFRSLQKQSAQETMIEKKAHCFLSRMLPLYTLLFIYSPFFFYSGFCALCASCLYHRAASVLFFCLVCLLRTLQTETNQQGGQWGGSSRISLPSCSRIRIRAPSLSRVRRRPIG